MWALVLFPFKVFMNLEYFIAKKVAASGKQSFSRLIIRIAVIAVAMSVAVMICATALISGFKKEISSKIFGFWGHIHITDANINRSLVEIHPVDSRQPFYPSLDQIGQVQYSEARRFLGFEYNRMVWTEGGVNHMQVFALKPGIIKARDEIEGIILKGVGLDFEWSFIEDYILEGTTLMLQDTGMSNNILISQQTARRLKVGVDDQFVVHFVERGEEVKRRFRICGIYKTGLEEYDQKFALVDIRQIQKLMNWKDHEVGGFEVFIEDISDLVPIAEHIYFDILPDEFYAETIREKFREIFEWLELQDINEIVIMGLMIIVAIINMVTALLILILERTNMIGILKALGNPNWNIRKVFLYYAAYIIVLGLFWGNFLGIGLCVIQDQFEVIKLSEENYYLNVAPIALDIWTVLLLNVGTLFVTLIFLVIPSYMVTRINPVKAIRFK